MITFFTSAFQKHKMFIPVFIISCLETHPDATIEIVVDNFTNMPNIDMLKNHYGKNKILIYQSKFQETSALFGGTIRFISIPKTINIYTYITDIDILMMESEIHTIHCDIMKKNNLCYSNIVRPSGNRMSGLQFLETKKYYDIITRSKINKTVNRIKNILNDENVLYEILKQNYALPPLQFSQRPVHGIHMSLNRRPYAPRGGFNWGITDIFKKKFIALQQTDIWQGANPFFDIQLTQLLKQI